MTPDFHLLIAGRTLWQEARGETIIGQRAVAHVLVNRRYSGRWGDTLGEVCLSEFKGVYQFSGWSRTDPNRKAAFHLGDTDPALVAMMALVTAAQTEPDLTSGALFYYSTRVFRPPAAPTWSKDMRVLGTFGTQIFLTDVPAAKPPLVA